MELMSSLLLCALAVFLPQALGKSSKKFSYDVGFNDSIIIRRKPSIGKNIILNKNSPSLINKISDLQSIFMDPTCRGCYGCMERSIKAHKVHTRMMNQHMSAENFQDALNILDRNRRDKRKVKTENLDTRQTEKKSKKSKSKKNKAVTIIKYNDNDKIYALKIKETNALLDKHNKTRTTTTCQVYSVQKSFSCESPEANLILTESKKKMNKKGKRGHGKREANVPEVIATVIAPVYRKRHIDDSQVPEQIMPSIEEMY